MENQPSSRRGWSDWIHRYPKLLGVVLVGVIVFSLLVVGGTAWAGKPVTLQVDGETIELKTKVGTVGELLEEHRVELGQYDEVIPGVEVSINRNLVVEIVRAVPITLIIDGGEYQQHTTKSNVEDFLQEQGVTINSLDQVVPDLHGTITPDMTIKITRIEKVIETKEIEIPFTNQREEDRNLLQGRTQVVKQGKPGKKIQEVEVTYADGKPVQSEVLSEEILEDPVQGVVAYGTKAPGGSVKTSRGDLRYSRRVVMEATAYSPQQPDLQKYGGITYTGIPAARGIVAVDPRVIPLGTKLYVDGYGFALAADIGGAIKGNKIDLCFDTVAEALRFGRRNVTVYVLGE